MDTFLREDRLPHIWCPGCGLGTALTCFIAALQKSGLDLDKVAVVSGIGCTGRVAGYVKLDSFHTTHGRAIPFATGLKLAHPELNVIVFSGDGDLIAIGGNHLIHAARRNIDLTVICVNNFNYGMTGGQVGPTTPLDDAPRQEAGEGHRRGARQAGLQLRGDHLPLPHRLWPSQSAARWAPDDALLSRSERHPTRCGSQGGGH
jgi:pyruvate/2-oxoacid:ferredoxin oxidoreductase beta subunit